MRRVLPCFTSVAVDVANAGMVPSHVAMALNRRVIGVDTAHAVAMNMAPAELRPDARRDRPGKEAMPKPLPPGTPDGRPAD